MANKYLLQENLIDAEGELTEEEDLIWQQTNLAIKDKIDSYGQLFDELNAEKKKLAFFKTSGVDRVNAALNRVESLETKLKRRLNMLSKGDVLKGDIYSFHPFLSRQRTLKYPELLKPEEAYLTIEIREDYWKQLHPEVGNIRYEVKKRTAKVSELPEDHPAVETALTPSVRIT